MARLEFILLLSPALFFSFFSSFSSFLLLSSSSIAPKSDSGICSFIALSDKFRTFSYIFRTFFAFLFA